MFAGIVEAVGTVETITPRRSGLSVLIRTPKGWKLQTGQSVAVDGICTTVVGKDARLFCIELMPQTLQKTTARMWRKGTRVNLERSLRFGNRIEGHFVQGHIDARAKVASVLKNKKHGHVLTVLLPQTLMRFIPLHGSLAVNGVSLTITRARKRRISVALIPHTIAHTNLGTLAKGDDVNIEVDLAARYILSGRGYARLTRDATKTLRKRN